MACVRFRKDTRKWGVDYNDETGHRRWITCNDRDAARILLAEKIKHPGGDPATTFGWLAVRWLKVTRAIVRPQSWQHYEATLRIHLLPHFGLVKLRKLSRWMILEFLTDKLKTMAPKSVSNLRAQLHSVFEFGMEYEGLANNPVKGIAKKLKLGSRVATKVKAFTQDQLGLLLETARRINSVIYVLILLMARTGLRIGEATALKWTDIDFEGRTILVERTWVDGGLQDAPKTESSNRRVDMSTQLAETLQRHRTAQLEAKLAGCWKSVPEWVFVARMGRPMHARSVISAEFKTVLKAAGLPLHFTPHSLRHTFACLHLANGANPVYVQKQLGHSSIQMTVDLYGSWFPIRDLAAADRLDDVEMWK